MKSIGLALLLSWMPACMAAQPGATMPPERQTTTIVTTIPAAQKSRHLSTDDTLRTLLDHPAFAGFARLLLPWDDRAYDPRMRLADLGTLLPYHSQIRPDVMVGAMNNLIDDAAAGHTIFHDIYSPAQKQQSPAKQHTGLFFFRGKPGAPFAIVCPGGGFSYVGSIHEGFPYATDIVKQGYNVFVLKYRVGSGGAVATQDLAAAISYVFTNAATLGVGIHDYSLWGSSAGARMVAAIGTRGVAGFDGDKRPLPAAIVMAYTGHTEHATSGDPPTFVVVGENDGIAPPAVMERRVAALRKTGTPVEYHKYRNLGHGFGVGTGTSAEGWTTDAIRFWRRFIRNRD